ncbi:hypothetical protein DMENIID0001_057150 [Sergentomyia squamirostris]
MPLYTTGLCPLLQSSPHWRRERIFVPKPRLIGHFSVIREEYVNSMKNVRYLCLPSTPHEQIQWDLNTGFENYTDQKQNPRGKIDRILKFIQGFPHKVSGRDKILFPDFVCSRGFLSTLMKTPYPRPDNNSRIMAPYPNRNKPSGWNVLASKYRGTIYLWPIDGDTKMEDVCLSQRKAMYYGFKFRQMITTHQLNKPSTIDEPYVREKFSGVFDTKLGQHRLLYAGEIFGVDSDVALKSHSDFLKPSVKIIQMHTKVNAMSNSIFLKDKLMHWWCKTVLIGAETIYAGNRTRQGILESIEPIAVRSIPRKAQHYWSDSVCLKFTIAFLDMVKAEMKDIDDPDTVYQFSYNPEIRDQVLYEILPKDSELKVLPSWYIDFLDGFSAAGPVEPLAKPAEHRAKTAKPRVKTAKPRAKPAEPRANPAESRVKPAEPRAKPAESRAKPAESRVKPAEPRAKPAESRVKPAETRAKPMKPAEPKKSAEPTIPAEPTASTVKEKAYPAYPA